MEKYLKDLAARNMVGQCGDEKVEITWTPQLSKEELDRLAKAGKSLQDIIKEYR
jgi:hypothetical protein